MKVMKAYLEVVKFDVNDVITASGDTGCTVQSSSGNTTCPPGTSLT